MDYTLTAINQNGEILDSLDFGYWVTKAEAIETAILYNPEAFAILKNFTAVWTKN